MKSNQAIPHPGRSPKYLVSMKSRRQPEAIGNKALGLYLLLRKGYHVPETYVVTWHAYLDYLAGGDAVFANLRLELMPVIQDGYAYAIRSSANIEDSLEHSYAGQFTTQINIMGIEQTLTAIRTIWDDAQKESVQTYAQRILGGAKPLKMAVIIQEMVQPLISGVVFSKNPITTMDEVIVEAVQGYGTALVQEGCTPFRWVNKWGSWIQTPQTSPVDPTVPNKIVEETRRLVKDFHKELDLEWVYDGKQLFWLQMRDITSLQNVTFYSNRISKEMTPGQIKPLVWTVSIPNPSLAWVRLISEAIGENPLEPSQLIKLFHYRAYFNMAEFGKVFASLGLPRESLEMMMGVLPPGAGKPPMKPGIKTISKLPFLAKFIWDKWHFSPVLESRYPILYDEIHKFPIHFLGGSKDERWLIQQIDNIHILNREVAYLTVVTILLLAIYTSFYRRQLSKIGVEFQQIDLTEGNDEFKLYKPEFYLTELHLKYQQLPNETQLILQAGDYQVFQDMVGDEGLKTLVDEFLQRFGHMSDTTAHFCNPAWREKPGFILQLVAEYENPAVSANNRIKFQDLPEKPFLLRRFYQRAKEYLLWREKVSSLFSYSVMLFRAYYLAIGENWVEKGYIKDAEEILYLYDDEVRAAIKGEANWSDLQTNIGDRKKEMQDSKEAVLPEVIMGEEMPLVVFPATGKLIGTPSSKGYYSGPVCVIKGVDEFHKLKPGDVMVIPFSDVSWTPLFARAGAVVAESGGTLSHSSIIAREYNIPGVVSVLGAMNLKDGDLVTIDGYKGEIIIHEPLPLEVINE